MFSTLTAQADGTSSAEAEARFKEAATLAKQAKYEEALAKYVQSYALEPRASVLLGMALAEYELKRDVEAIRHLREYLRSPKAQNVEELRSKFFVPLHEQTGHYRVRTPPGAQISLDGAPATPIDDILDVKPGAHVLTAGEERREATVAKGQTLDVDLTPAPASTPPHDAVGAGTVITPPPAIEPTASSTHWFVAGGLLVGAAVATGVGIGFGLASSSSTDDAENMRRASPGLCRSPSSLCDTYRSKASDADGQATISTVGYVGGGVLLAGAVVSYLLLRPTARATSGAAIFPTMGLGGGGAVVRTHF